MESKIPDWIVVFHNKAMVSEQKNRRLSDGKVVYFTFLILNQQLYLSAMFESAVKTFVELEPSEFPCCYSNNSFSRWRTS